MTKKQVRVEPFLEGKRAPQASPEANKLRWSEPDEEPDDRPPLGACCYACHRSVRQLAQQAGRLHATLAGRWQCGACIISYGMDEQVPEPEQTGSVNAYRKLKRPDECWTVVKTTNSRKFAVASQVGINGQKTTLALTFTAADSNRIAKVPQLERAVASLIECLRDYLDGDTCDHSVGICYCHVRRTIQCAEELLIK